jgi:hypothetical protein
MFQEGSVEEGNSFTLDFPYKVALKVNVFSQKHSSLTKRMKIPFLGKKN